MRAVLLRPFAVSLCFTALLGVFAACGSDDEGGGSDNIDKSTASGSGAGSSGDGGNGASGGEAASGGSGASTVSSSSASGSGGGCVGLGDACSDCAVDACNALYCTCAANTDCTTLIACLDGCAGNQGCAQNCLSSTPAGISDAVLLNDCASGACGAQCPTTQPLDACQKCAAQMCPQQLSACLANPECTPLIECVTDCGGDFFCQAGCADEYGGGQNVAEDLGGCVEGVCPACG